jgi:hypothetical protein
MNYLQLMAKKKNMYFGGCAESCLPLLDGALG